MGWVLIVIAFLISRPLGIILLVIKVIRMASKRLSQPKQPQPRPQPVPEPPRRPPEIAPSPSPSPKAERPVEKPKARLSARSGAATVLQILGGVMMVAAVVLLIRPDSRSDGIIPWPTLLPILADFCAGAVAIICGTTMQNRRNRVVQYLALWGDREMVTIDELVSVSGKPQTVVIRDVQHMLRTNILDAGAFLDTGRGILFKSAEAYQDFLGQNAEPTAAYEDMSEEYADILRAIRKANDRIPDPVFSDKLDRMEEIAGRIFREVEAHPEKRKQATRFFDYYLPTTLKLLDKYVEFQEAGVENDDLRQVKAHIEASMGNLLASFEKQLGDFYSDKVMDIDAELRVMETMLNRDFSSAKRDFGENLKKG